MPRRTVTRTTTMKLSRSGSGWNATISRDGRTARVKGAKTADDAIEAARQTLALMETMSRMSREGVGG